MWFKKLYVWIRISYESIKYIIGITLYRSAEDIFSFVYDKNERNQKNQRVRHRNPVLEKFYAGKTDEKYVREFYEVLKKADNFMRTATPRQMAVAADKNCMSYGIDAVNREKFRFEHFGFYDEKSKHAGKTVQEVIEIELEERRVKDDNLKLVKIFNNKPIEAGLAKALKTEVKKRIEDDIVHEFETLNTIEKSKQFEFPLKAFRNVDCANKIEQLTEFLHIKNLGDEIQLEFLIPIKFKSNQIPEDSPIFKELIDINYISISDGYGAVTSYGIKSYLKRITHEDKFDVLKFHAFVIEDLGTY